MCEKWYAIGLVVLVASLAEGVGDWPQWLGPNRDGISTETASGPLLNRPQHIWSASVGLGVSSPVVSRGRAVIMGHVKGSGGRGTDTVYCLDSQTGAVLWQHSYDCRTFWSQDVRFDGPRATPTIDGQAVYTLSLEGHLICMEMASGKVRWSRQLTKHLQGRIPVYGYCCSPLVYGRGLILELNAPEAAYVALDKATGQVIWRFDRGQVTCGSPVLGHMDGLDCAVFAGGGLIVGLDPLHGKQRWRHRTWGHAWMGPVVFSNKVFMANASLPRGCGLISITDGNPTILWEDKQKFQTLHCNTVAWNGHLYGFDNTGTDYQGSDSKKSSFKCLVLETGQVKWVKEKMGWGNLIVFDGKLIILRETGELVIAAATPESYLEHSRADVIDGRSWTVPALTDGRLYCRNNTGQVVCLQLLGAAGKMQPVSQAGPTPPISHPSGTMPEGLTQIAPTKTSSADRAVTQTAPSRWPRFRGPGGLGLAPFDGVPTVWNTQTGEGIVWKTALPLAGQSSPVLWDKRIFLSGASKTKRQVYCLDTNTGKLLWQTTINTSSNSLGDQAEDTASVLLAASTPVADGRHVYALYGNGDLACLDFDGQVVWTRSFGKPDNMYGYAASLERWRNLLLVQLDQASAKDRLSKLAALDVSSGRTVWEVPRPVPSSWSSPIVINTVGAEQIITAGDPWVIAYEPATAAEIWRANCLGGEVVPSPIFANGLVLAVSVDGKFAAIRPDGKGDITQTHVAWSEEEHLPPICSPVSHDELVFLLDTGGLLACLDVRNGKLVWEHDLGTSFQASPSVVKGLLYLISDQGVAFIIKANRKYELVAANPLGEECQASPAFQPGRIYVRGKHHLFAIGQAGK